MKKKCVITGMGIVSCFGSDKKVFYKSLLEGRSGVKAVDFDVSGLENLFGAAVTGFNAEDFMDRKNARRMDPAMAFAIAGAQMAIKDAQLDTKSLDPERAGAIIGTGIGGMHASCKNFKTAYEKKFSRVSPFFIPHLIPNMPGAVIGIEHGFQGPNYPISTACASTNYSLLAAKKYIEEGSCDVMLAGGVEASMNVGAFAGFSALHALSKSHQDPSKASRPFDKKRDGFVLGEGCGIFVLESEEHAKARGAKIYATLSGGGINTDAYHMTNPLASGGQVARCMKMALEDAGLKPEDIDLINTHATSTPVGDTPEINAINSVFGEVKDKPVVQSTKSMIGHALGASGALELAGILMAMETGTLHPTINLDDPEEGLEGYDLVRNEPKEKQVKHAISNSFAFGGHNSVIVVSK